MLATPTGYVSSRVFMFQKRDFQSYWKGFFVTFHSTINLFTIVRTYGLSIQLKRYGAHLIALQAGLENILNS